MNSNGSTEFVQEQRQTIILDPDKLSEGEERQRTQTTRSDERAKSSSVPRNVLRRAQLNDNTIKNEDTTTGSTSESRTHAATQAPVVVSRFLSIHLHGSIDIGNFNSVNDVYMKYSIVTGPDWLISSGSDVGITQISRYKKDSTGARVFVWNQPISISYRSYNYFGWPQIVLSVYYFDTFGNDQILGYGCIHLPVSSQTGANFKQSVQIYAPQSTSMLRQILSWIVGRKPELVDSNLFARPDCRSVLRMVHVGQVEVSFNLTTKDVSSNGYRS